MSSSGRAIGTIENRNIHIGCNTVLTEFSSVIVWLFLCVAECNGDRQCNWPSNGGTVLKVF
jgi:hypothetical protein